MNKKQKQLKPLYIEDLGQVKGGFCATTLAIGEEGIFPIDPPDATTLAIGEEDGGGFPPPATTLALGEEDGGGGATTLALGEE